MEQKLTFNNFLEVFEKRTRLAVIKVDKTNPEIIELIECLDMAYSLLTLSANQKKILLRDHRKNIIG